jgi:serine/threonine-protein kinase RsbW
MVAAARGGDDRVRQVTSAGRWGMLTPMEINYSLVLPRDALTVPVVRRLVRGAMVELGVRAEDISDVSLAVTEACANVIEHSSAEEDEYRVEISVSEVRCDIRIIDTGRGFDAEELDRATLGDLEAERGRGIRMMQALVDSAEFISEPESGTVVHLTKHLELEDDSMFRRLTQRLAARHGDEAAHR